MDATTALQLKAEPLTRERFKAFGDVIESESAKHFSINGGTIERFHDLAKVDLGEEPGGRALVSIAECNVAAELPYRMTFVERHPRGSQAFVPLDDTPLVVVVAPPGETVSAADLRAFVSNGRQGINYHRGVWHLPLISFRQGQRMLIVDRGGPGENCEEYHFPADEIVVTL